MRDLAARWLKESSRPELCEFLEHDFRALGERYGPVFGMRIPTPKLIPIPSISA